MVWVSHEPPSIKGYLKRIDEDREGMSQPSIEKVDASGTLRRRSGERNITPTRGNRDLADV